MKGGRWITHGLAIGIGLAVAFAFSGKSAMEQPPEAAASEHRALSRRTRERATTVRPREMLRALAFVPMESQERSSLKWEIYSKWAEEDPLGFLAHFEHRPLTRNNSNAYAYAFSALAKTHPEELLAYARRTGCEDAADTLVSEADPAVVLALLKQGGCERFPKNLLETLAEKGEELDPHFHEMLAEIQDPEARKSALSKAASEMVSAGRMEDFISFLGQNPEALAPEDAGRSIGKLLLMDRRELGRLDALEGEVREAAVGEIISSLHDGHVSEQGQRELLADLAIRGDLDSRRMDVFEKVAGADDISKASAEAWKNWALSLSGVEQTRPLQLGAMALWSMSTKAEADEFAAIPEGELRDGAVVGGMGRYLQDENLPEARKMIGLIGDAALREKLEGFLKLMENDEEPDDFDPFGFEEKP